MPAPDRARAPINQPGWSPLHYAAAGPEPKIVALLLERGAIVDAEAPNRSTPLMMAAGYGKEESVRGCCSRAVPIPSAPTTETSRLPSWRAARAATGLPALIGG